MIDLPGLPFSSGCTLHTHTHVVVNIRACGGSGVIFKAGVGVSASAQKWCIEVNKEGEISPPVSATFHPRAEGNWLHARFSKLALNVGLTNGGFIMLSRVIHKESIITFPPHPSLAALCNSVIRWERAREVQCHIIYMQASRRYFPIRDLHCNIGCHFYGWKSARMFWVLNVSAAT